MFNHAVPTPQATANRPTPRELEVLALVVLGCTTPDICHRLDVSVDTVKTHLRRLMAKFGAKNRSHLVLCAQLHGTVVVEWDKPSRSVRGAIVATGHRRHDGTPGVLISRVGVSRA